MMMLLPFWSYCNRAVAEVLHERKGSDWDVPAQWHGWFADAPGVLERRQRRDVLHQKRAADRCHRRVKCRHERNARGAADEYYFGPDLLVAPVLSPVTVRALYLPQGRWIDYWTGRGFAGCQTIAVEAPLDRIPLFVREGAVLPKIPDDVMTLVPQGEFKDRSVQALDERRVYEIYPGQEARTITDFEGRKLVHSPREGTLTITRAPARVSVRWRFAHPSIVTLDGQRIDKLADASDGVSVEFEHRGASTLRWR